MNLILFTIILMYIFQISKLDRLTPNDTSIIYQSYRIIHPEKLHPCHIYYYFPEVIRFNVFCDPTYEIVKTLPELDVCTGFDCWESQLSMVTRLEIIDIMNRYRNKVALKKCLKWCENNTQPLVFELEWSYYLERNATLLIKSCPKFEHTMKFTEVYITNSPIHTPALKEEIAISFKMETGLQSELRNMLWRLMYENRLLDWNETTSDFQRGAMHAVACAFVCRRGVNYVTSLNEVVVNGIVGHFACVFVTQQIKETPAGWRVLDTSLHPGEITCKLSSKSSKTTYGMDNYYPHLCRLDINPAGVFAILYHSCEFGPTDNISNLCVGQKFSPLTWKERTYGLTWKTVRIPPAVKVPEIEGTCYDIPALPSPHKFGKNIYNYRCTLKEIVYVNADTSKCPGWNCADSQLTDVTRMQILDVLNEARHLVSVGNCSEECPPPCKRCNINAQYCNMVNLQWHWFLERKASQIVRNCPTKNFLREVFYDDDPFPGSARPAYEEVSVLFDLPYGEGQLALAKTIKKLFWMNAFADWTKYHWFRRANAEFIGCSIVQRPHYVFDIPEMEPRQNFYNGIPTHMVCIYASLTDAFYSIIWDPRVDCCPRCPPPLRLANPCWTLYVKEEAPYPNLCSSVPVLITMNCQVNFCKDGSISKAWYMGYEGLRSVQYIDGHFEHTNSTAFNSIGKLYQKMYCPFLVGFCVIQMLFLLLVFYLIFTIDDIKILYLLKKTIMSFKPRLPKIEFPKMFSKETPEEESVTDSDFSDEALPSAIDKSEASSEQTTEIEPNKEPPAVSIWRRIARKTATTTPPTIIITEEPPIVEEQEPPAVSWFRRKTKTSTTTPPTIIITEEPPIVEEQEPPAVSWFRRKTKTSTTSPPTLVEPQEPGTSTTWRRKIKTTTTSIPTIAEPKQEPESGTLWRRKAKKTTTFPPTRATTTTTKPPPTSPAVIKTPIRKPYKEESDNDDWELEEDAYTGPSGPKKDLGVGTVPPTRLFKERERRKRPPPKRAATTTIPTWSRKTKKKDNQ